MKQVGWIVVSAMAVLGVGGVISGCGRNQSPPEAVVRDNGTKRQTICPVMGNPVDKKLFVDSDGKRIYVCCSRCLGKVKNDPEKYIKQLESEGVTLDKTP